jgi:hypothetical protein
MGKRYSNIKQAGKLQTALENYIKYLTTPPEHKLGTKGARPTQIKLYIIPFNVKVSTGEFVATKAQETPFGEYDGAFSTYTKNTLASDQTLISLKRFKPARANIVTIPPNTKATVTPSHITKTNYLKVTKSSVSIPFGSNSGQTLNEGTVFNTISNNSLFTAKRVYLIREVFTFAK